MRSVSIFAVAFAAVVGMFITSGCASGNTTTQAATTSTSNPYAAVYKSVKWGSTVTVSFPTDCTMQITTSGEPDYTPNAWYLAPANGNQKVVAHTAASNMALALISYEDVIRPNLRGSTATLNICPEKASSTTPANLGAIGYLISGTAMFNPFEADGSTAAVADNASYTFTDANGNQQTAYFLDQCNSHSNGMTWHAHGTPDCVTSQVDSDTGPSHVIGISLDGYPIYGGRDINGNIVDVKQLDVCNGITSPTPEFPGGAYHYVLPIGVTSKYASINCYAGKVQTGTVAQAAKLACNMKTMFAMLTAPDVKKQEPAREATRKTSPSSFAAEAM